MRRWLSGALVCLLAACGGGSNGSPTAPSTQTRIIHIDGDLNFGSVTVGTTADRSIRVFNQGNAPLTISGMTGPSGYTASWTNGTIGPNNAFQDVTVHFAPTEPRDYSGTLTINGNQTSGTNTKPISGQGLGPLFSRGGVGDNVFDIPSYVTRIHIIADYGGYSSNFIVHIAGDHVVNELIGTGWGTTHFEGTYLIHGGTVEILNSSGVRWLFVEVR